MKRTSRPYFHNSNYSIIIHRNELFHSVLVDIKQNRAAIKAIVCHVVWPFFVGYSVWWHNVCVFPKAVDNNLLINGPSSNKRLPFLLGGLDKWQELKNSSTATPSSSWRECPCCICSGSCNFLHSHRRQTWSLQLGQTWNSYIHES